MKKTSSSLLGLAVASMIFTGCAQLEQFGMQFNGKSQENNTSHQENNTSSQKVYTSNIGNKYKQAIAMLIKQMQTLRFNDSLQDKNIITMQKDIKTNKEDSKKLNNLYISESNENKKADGAILDFIEKHND